MSLLRLASGISLLVTCAIAAFNATEDAAKLVISNDRLYASVSKATGAITNLTLDGQNLLGVSTSAVTGVGPYLDCYCTPSGFYTPGSKNARFKLISGVDSSATPYGGIVMSETYAPTGQVLEQYWFLREGETGLHTFSRLYYFNETTPFLRNLQEFRTLFRPNSSLWTHLSTNEIQYAPLPSKDAVSKQVVVQDATWYLGNTPQDPYVVAEADYFTKYTFQDTWRDHDVHGMYSDGSTSDSGDTFGAWLVMNTKDTYFGGPLHSDLVVDGIVYNYIVSNHHGEGTPNITNGFDRTFGPQYFHFNRASAGTPLQELRLDAAQYGSPTWNADFYDSIAEHVPNYVPGTGRTTFKAHVDLPVGAVRPVAVLAQNKVSFQDNALDTKAFQYWADIDPSTGDVSIPRVIAGTYRMTIYAEGIFGDYIKDDVVITAGEVHTVHARWREDTAGKEIFRIGTPDKSSGEYKHGYEKDLSRTNTPEQYRIYWPVWDFVKDFPEGVRYKVGESSVAKDLNYVHWSVFGGRANSLRPEEVYDNINNWTIAFDMEAADFNRKRQATFTVLLAGAKTAAGNTDVYNASEPYANLPYTVSVNGHDLEPWVIPYYQSSSCAVRSAVICYQLAHKFTFDPKFFVAGENELVLSLPYNATDYEPALLPSSVYVQYDALRLEVV
ncbi:rhamnogalacturonate lyase [Phlyctema vagabunda]|uniref:Rhamnogalacturonate lyase n=1 Tax=Phlyctema vagabunda TaxID=108571 RepID=A0ABR4PR88_9HELO